MGITTRLSKLENILAVREIDIHLVGWTDADFYPVTDYGVIDNIPAGFGW